MSTGIVLLNGFIMLATCALSTAADGNPAAASIRTNSAALVEIHCTIRGGRVLVPLRINASDPLSFLLDTGYSMTMLRADIAAKLELKRVGGVTIAGIAGDERADVFEGVTLELGGAAYSPRRVAALPAPN